MIPWIIIGLKHEHLLGPEGILMNDKIIFDRSYFIKSTQTKEIMAHYILQKYFNGALYFTALSHFHTRKSFRLNARSEQCSVIRTR